jgi:hypothetical protein
MERVSRLGNALHPHSLFQLWNGDAMIWLVTDAPNVYLKRYLEKGKRMAPRQLELIMNQMLRLSANEQLQFIKPVAELPGCVSLPQPSRQSTPEFSRKTATPNTGKRTNTR